MTSLFSVSQKFPRPSVPWSPHLQEPPPLPHPWASVCQHLEPSTTTFLHSCSPSCLGVWIPIQPLFGPRRTSRPLWPLLPSRPQIIQLRFYPHHFSHSLANTLGLLVLLSFCPESLRKPQLSMIHPSVLCSWLVRAATEKSHCLACWCSYQYIASSIAQDLQFNCQSFFF